MGEVTGHTSGEGSSGSGSGKQKAPPPEELDREELLRRVREQAVVIEKLRRENDHLRRQLREAKRQAGSFSRGCKDPVLRKKPGRKCGQGPFTRRKPPKAGEVTRQVKAEVPPEQSCPCGGELEFVRYEKASITELPERPRPEVTAFQVTVCRCKRCGRKVRGRHPKLAPDQYGATAHRLGPRVKDAAHVMHYGIGVPVRKVGPVLKELCGIEVTQSAITQDAVRRAEGEVGEKYEELRRSVPQAPVVHTDDTGWRVNGQPAQLMVFATTDTPEGTGKTVYQIRAQHRNEEVREVLPETFAGTMVTDRGRSYDAEELDKVKQQKCQFHVRRSIDEVLLQKSGAARGFGETLKATLKEGMDLLHDFQSGKTRGFRRRARELKEEISHQLRPRTMRDPDNQRVLNELGWHDDRGNLTRFLDGPQVPPTNNLAEQQLRGAVIARKVSHCSKNDRGAHAHETFSSIIRTEQRRHPPSLINAIFQKLRPHTVRPLAQAPP